MQEDRYSKERYAFDRPNEAPRFIDLDFKEYLASQSGAQQSKIDRGDFLSLDGQELRFKCFWNNEGIQTDLLLRYFLSTSEMMVMELGTFEGKDPFPTLFKRGQLPLDWRSIGSEPGGLPRGTACYGPEQFRLGRIVDLYGRQVKLMKCDDFTRLWYENNKGTSFFCLCGPVLFVSVCFLFCFLTSFVFIMNHFSSKGLMWVPIKFTPHPHPHCPGIKYHPEMHLQLGRTKIQFNHVCI
jgi:hypothetical protein